MKKINLLRRALLLTAGCVICSTLAIAQSAAKKPGMKITGSKEAALSAKQQQALQTKYEANGMSATPTQLQTPSNPAARPCLKTTAAAPSQLKRSTYNNLPARTREHIDAHPEKYKIVD